jgi:protein-arginine kinase activator protein McsA
MKRCKCGRLLCELCERRRAKYVMKNVRNGNKLNVCETCYRQIWGKEAAKE